MSSQPEHPADDGPGAAGAIEGDAKGALKGGEAHRGDQASAPQPLGRKDPTVSGGSRPDKDNVLIR